MTAKYTALVLGASGLVGKALVTELLSDPRYKQVTCLIRRPLLRSDFDDPDNKLQPVVIDFEQLDDLQGYFTVDHVFVCLGTTIKKAKSLHEQTKSNANKQIHNRQIHNKNMHIKIKIISLPKISHQIKSLQK